ncbi:MAG: hypothetical protein EBX22_03550 [Candidatus Fonsibacter ubiquis]|nr:hypothetical protein [Candidatus Fonsibacter ubiquis]
MGWTPEKTEQLKKLWNEGHTASQIAAMLGDGISRNAVIGKSHRLGLASRSHSRNIYIQKSENKFHHKNSVPLKRLRKPRGLRAIVIEKDFEPENPTSLENLNEKTCSVLHAYQPKGWKNEEEDKNTKGTEELPEFFEKKIKSA